MAMPITLILVDLGAVSFFLSWPRRLSTAMLGSSAFRAGGGTPPRYFEEAIGREKIKKEEFEQMTRDLCCSGHGQGLQNELAATLALRG